MTGNTENVASEIQKALGDKVGEPVEIADIGADGLTDYDGFIVGAPTWHTDADDNRSGTSWDDELANIAALDLNGKPCAIFGLGDRDALDARQREYQELPHHRRVLDDQA